MFTLSQPSALQRRLHIARSGLSALCVAALVAFAAAPAFALDPEARGFGLDRAFGVTGAYGFGTRHGLSGQTFLVRAEGAGYFMRTPMHNRGGIEGGVELGYDGYDPASLGFLWDLWLGFPITLFELSGDDGPLFTTALAPGVGVSNQHAYAYIKGKVAARIVPRVAMELAYQWTPYTASITWENGVGNHAGFAMAMLRYATYFSLNDDLSLMAYFDWRQSNLDDPNPGTDKALQEFSSGMYSSGAFSPIVRTRWDNNFRIGIGLAF